MIITLLADLGLSDNFVGVIKGVILGINPRVKIVHISHGILTGDILQAAFLLELYSAALVPLRYRLTAGVRRIILARRRGRRTRFS